MNKLFILTLVISIFFLLIFLTRNVNADLIYFGEVQSNEILLSDFSNSEVNNWVSTCGDNQCIQGLEDSSSCPLDCKIGEIISPVGLTGGSAGATYEQIVECPFGFEKVDGKCIKIEKVIEEKVIEKETALKGIVKFIQKNTSLVIISLIMITFILYRMGRFRGRKYEIKNHEDEEEKKLNTNES